VVRAGSICRTGMWADSVRVGCERVFVMAARSTDSHLISRAHTRERVAERLALGETRAEIARALGLSKGTISYHARRLGSDVDDRCARRYDWNAVQAHYDAGHTVRECVAAFGFSSSSWFHAVKRGVLQPRPTAMPVEDLLVADTYRGRENLKLRLLRGGLKTSCCERCGIESWRGRPLSLALHHVNGVRNDNRLENLELLCPNCHSQTDNFAGRNCKRRTSSPVAEQTSSANLAARRGE
jgi:DNA-binding transcriptional ArsR family regulator